MKNQNNQKLIYWIFAVIIILPIIGSLLKAAEKVDVVVIAHKDAKDGTLKKDDIENIFLGKKTKWSDNEGIIFVILDSGDVHEAFLKDYVGKTKSQFDSYWKKQVFTGKGKMPDSYKKEKDLLDYVAKTKGAIGYVSKATLEENKDKVKTIETK